MERLLRVRAQLKKKKPNFRRSGFWRGGPLKQGYRRPKGIDNKLRMKLKSKPKMINIGYSSPKHVRGLHSSGLRPHIINCIADLNNLKPKIDIVIVAGSVGAKKKKEIIDEAKKRKLKIANPNIKQKEEEE